MTTHKLSLIEDMVSGFSTKRAVTIAWFIPALFGALGILFFMYSFVVVEEKNVLLNKIVEIEQARVPEVEAELLNTIHRADSIGYLLERHRDGAAPLRLLEEHLQSDVSVSSIEIDYEIPSMKIIIQTPNAGTIARQASAFEDDSRIVGVDVGQITRIGETSAYRGEIVVRLDAAVLRAFPRLSQ